MTSKVFKLLMDKGGVISGDEMGEELGISRIAVHKHINKLRELGVNIKATGKGYFYEVTDTLTEFTLRYSLASRGIDIPVFVEPVDSTNNHAKRIALEEERDFLCVAPYQTNGRGRLARSFSSGVGGCYMTFCYRPQRLEASQALNIVLLSGVAVKNALKKYGIECRIKWPNDVFAGGKKITGILLESALSSEYIERMFLGIGINVNNDLSGLEDIAISARDILGRELRRENVITELMVELIGLLKEFETDGFDRLRKEYIASSCTIGNKISVEYKGEIVTGKATGLSDKGYLELETDSGMIQIVAGDIMPA